jgi:hypothetical protein
MSYPSTSGPKGSQTPSSLPPRPPPPANPQAFSKNNRNHAGNSFTAFTGFQPRAVAAQQQSFRPENPAVIAGPQQPSNYAPPSNYDEGQGQYPQSAYYGAGYDEQYQPTPPQIRNPFVAPSATAGRNFTPIDPEMEAQIAQWQSAYTSKDDKRLFSGVGVNGAGREAMTASELSSAANPNTGVAAVVTGADGKQKTVIRKGGGETWQDPTLLEWNPAHFRLFVGNLAGEVTDESLLKAFAKYTSVQKARVIRDKRTTKSKGFGFVSFSDGDEYFKAAKEMQGKYIGSHPVLLRKSTTEIKAVTPKDPKKGGKHGKGGHGEDRTGAGIQKKQNKTKGGLKIIG